MIIQFLGGAQTVTGSQHLIQVNGKNILLECGLFQGKRKDTYKINRSFSYDPEKLDVMLLSHAHIDHSGNIPNLVKRGYDGPIYATGATVDLCKVMLLDSAYLQERDAKWLNKKRKKKGIDPVEPLYTTEDVGKALSAFVGVQYDRSLNIAPGVNATFRDAGHILGSAGIFLDIEEKGKRIALGFSGDIGRKGTPILADPNVLRDLDLLIMESTYGDRIHEKSDDVMERLAMLIRSTAESGGKIIIPAFAVGRTQLLVYMLHLLFDQDRIPSVPIFVDSPLATNATEIFRLHPECFDREVYRQFLLDHHDPFGFARLKYIREVKNSKELNSLQGPHIIISASGMAEGGRVLYHLRNNIANPQNMILFVGYAAEHTLARRIMDGAKRVNILGDEFEVRARVEKVFEFSAHADRDMLLEYVGHTSPEKLKQIFLVHGEADMALPLLNELIRRGYPSVHFPPYKSEFSI